MHTFEVIAIVGGKPWTHKFQARNMERAHVIVGAALEGVDCTEFHILPEIENA